VNGRRAEESGGEQRRTEESGGEHEMEREGKRKALIKHHREAETGDDDIQDDMPQKGKKSKKSKKSKKGQAARASTQHHLLDLVTAFVPFLDMQHTELLYRAIDPLLKDEDTTTRKKALKVSQREGATRIMVEGEERSETGKRKEGMMEENEGGKMR
jgi:hypothetical protein